MHRRSIKTTEGLDVLRWGYLEKGMFNIKETYNIRIGSHAEDGETWKKLWTLNLWPKVATFARMMVKGRILTGENLRKRGFQGPFRCCLCLQAEETTNHLLDSCPFSMAI